MMFSFVFVQFLGKSKGWAIALVISLKFVTFVKFLGKSKSMAIANVISLKFVEVKFLGNARAAGSTKASWFRLPSRHPHFNVLAGIAPMAEPPSASCSWIMCLRWWTKLRCSKLGICTSLLSSGRPPGPRSPAV